MGDGPASSGERLRSHLERRYGISVAALTELDLGVFRVDRPEGSPWVARIFPAARPLVGIDGDAEILRYLQQHDFPAERCAHPDAVSSCDGQGVLVTEFAEGTRARGSERTFYQLGDLLGRLHTLPPGSGAVARDGGAWHHLTYGGGPREEIAAAMSLLAGAERRVPAGEQGLYAELRGELGRTDDCRDLPHALAHPDFVPVNVIATPGGELVAVDWTGAGRGPRISCLGFLLWAAGVRDLTRVDAVIDGYRSHVSLEADELERLAGTIRARPLVFECWAFGTGRKSLSDVARGWPATCDRAAQIAARAGQAFGNRAGQVSAKGALQQPTGPALEGVGGTGLTIAAIRAAETARPDRLFADPLAEAFVEASGWSPSAPPDDRRARALKSWVVARTVFLDELLVSACEDGCRQVVLLGAGFDSRAFRLPWPPGVRCFELDTADVLASKAQVLASNAAVPRCERFPVACDLRADWPGALLAAGFAPGQPAAWVAEGLLVYLTSEEVDGVLADLTALTAPSSRLGLTMSSRDPGAAGQQAPPSRTRRHSSAPDDPVRWLAGHGWSAQLTEAREVLRAHGRPAPASAADPAPGSPRSTRPRGLLISATRARRP